MKSFWIALANLRRMFRVRTNIFFVFVFPMVLILVLGATFGGSSSPRLGVVNTGSGPLGAALLRQLEQTPHVQVVTVSDPAVLLTQVERGNLAAGVVIPPGYDSAVRAGHDAMLRYLARPDQSSQRLGETVRGAVARQAALLGAARFAVTQHAVSGFGAGLAAATRITPSVPAVSVTQATAGTTLFSRTLGQFDEGAWTELLLFLFLTAMTGSVALIETRRLGLSRRMLATPTSPATVITGETLGRVLISCVQALVIILGSALLFGVNWGQPVGVAAVVIVFALVAAGAGVFVGTLFRNEQQAIGISLLLGLGLGALGGCMVPLEVFSPVMRRVAHITPQAWGNDAFARLVGHGASITGILPQLGVLAAYAAVLLTLAAWRLRRVLSG
ncbi:MAG TPA: ABC transporter permease [Streptosporangiaceae bacterium]|nr:ABC transporter permease [Streptosporangiaceae bacterium]